MTTIFLEPSLSNSELKEAVNHLRVGKAPGIDNTELIKESGEEGIRGMHKMLCNKIWQQKAWPKDWKRVISPSPHPTHTHASKEKRHS